MTLCATTFPSKGGHYIDLCVYKLDTRSTLLQNTPLRILTEYV